MTPELVRALKRHTQWYGSYTKSGELKKVPVWLTLNQGRIEFITPARTYKVKRTRRIPRVICFVGSANGPAINGTAEIITDQKEIWRVYWAYWKTHPFAMPLLAAYIGVQIALGMYVVIRVHPDEPNPLAGLTDPLV